MFYSEQLMCCYETTKFEGGSRPLPEPKSPVLVCPSFSFAIRDKIQTKLLHNSGREQEIWCYAETIELIRWSKVGVQIEMSDDVQSDVVNVSPGYARNYLLPQGKAHEVTPSSMRQLDNLKKT